VRSGTVLHGVTRRLASVFADARCEGFLHVREIDGGGDVALNADAVVVAASVFKVQVALEFFRQVAIGELDQRQRVRVDPRQSIGAPAGLSLFADEIEVSLRDLAVSMMTISDAVATDVLVEYVGLERVNELSRSLGLVQTWIAGDVKWMFDTLASELGFAGGRAFLDHGWTDPEETARVVEQMPSTSVCDPGRTTRTTAREMTQLLTAIWRDEAAPPEACSAVRALMGRQLQRERIARGFRDPSVRFAGKTGSFGGAFRNEVGVAEFPDGRRYAIAVFTKGLAPYSHQRDIDDAIGVAAGMAVEALRCA
jgi:beta-lactamase class A